MTIALANPTEALPGQLARPLTVMLVAQDRTTLRKLSRFLVQFGYDVVQAMTPEQVRFAAETKPFDLIIFESCRGTDKQDWNTVRQTVDLARSKRACVYAVLLVESPTVETIHAGLRSGVDDFLTIPLNLGELLFRLRAGARVIEHRRRGRQHGHLDSVTGLPTSGAFLEQLAQRLRVSQENKQSTACIAINLDFFGRYRIDRGQAFFERSLAAVAARLSARTSDTAVLGCEQKDQFFVALNNLSENEAADWAQHFAEQFAKPPITVDDVPLDITLSLGVAASEGTRIASGELLRRAVEAQKLAKRSGRNTLATYSEVMGENMDWRDLAAPSALLKDTTARDVMAPCTVVIGDDEPVERAAHVMRKAHLPVLPVVNRSGRLLGYLTDSQLENASPRSEPARKFVVDDVATFAEDASFGTLVNFFIAQPSAVAFVVRNGQPMGWVTLAGLASLTESLNEQSFATSEPARHSTSYMLVTDESQRS